MDRTSKGFAYLKIQFPRVSDAKIKEGICIRPQIRDLTSVQNFDEQLNNIKKAA